MSLKKLCSLAYEYASVHKLLGIGVALSITYVALPFFPVISMQFLTNCCIALASCTAVYLAWFKPALNRLKKEIEEINKNNKELSKKNTELKSINNGHKLQMMN